MQKKGKSFKRKKYIAMALTLAGLCCYGAGPAWAGGGGDDTNLIITDYDNGPYSNTDDTHNVSGTLILGDQSGDTGTYTITGDSAQTNVNFISGGNGSNPNGALIVGNGGTGNFTQGTDTSTDPNNQVNVAGDLVLGHQLTSIGTYTLNSGTLTVGGQVAVGGQSTATDSGGNALNVFTQNGGTLILTNSANQPTVNPDYVSVPPGSGAFGGKLAVGGGISSNGGNDGGIGTYTMTNGIIDATANGIEIGPSGTGTMNQSGGDVKTTFLTEGFSGTGTYILSGTGTIESYSESVGYAGTGTFNQSGGTHTIATELRVGVQYASNSPGQGTYNLTGGTLSSGNTFVGQGETGTFVVSDPVALSTTHTVNGNLILGTLSLPGTDNDGNPIQQLSGNGSYTITGNNSQLNVNFVPGGNGAADPAGSNGATNNIDNPAPNGALIVGDSGTGTFTQGLADKSDTLNAVKVSGDLVLGNQVGSQGQYTLNTGNLTVGGKMVVGGQSTATDSNGNALNVFTQNGGSVNISGSALSSPDYVGVGGIDWSSWLTVGSGFGSKGTYTMNGGSLTTSGIQLGLFGVGTFNQSGGTVDAGGTLWLGNGGSIPNGAGFYNLTGNGQLAARYEGIGLFGHGEFVQNGQNTLNDVNGNLEIATGPFPDIDANTTNPRSGSYELDAGTLKTINTIVGVQGIGTFTQNGGSHKVSDTLTVGQQYTTPGGDPGSTVYGGAAPGTYNMNGGSLNVKNGIIGDAGNGTFLQTHGDVTVTENLTLGNAATTGVGTYTFNGGTLTVGGKVIVGNAGTGTFNQYADLDLSSSGGIVLGSSLGGTGTYNLASGVTLRDNLIVGDAGTGTFNNNGGTHNVSGDLILGNQSSGNGTYNLKPNGNLSVTGTTIVGAKGTGLFEQTGGTTNNSKNLIIGNNAGSNGTYNLSGGNLDIAESVTIQAQPGSTGKLDMTGGTLTAASLTNNGTFDYSAGALTLGGGSGTLTNNVGATLNNTGTLSNSGTLKNFGTLNNQGTLDNSGTLNNNGLINGGGTLLNSGLLTGSGTITGAVNNSGTVNPGNSPGTLSIIGSYTQTGTFVAELGGSVQGFSYDWLNINGTASLNGILDIYLYGGFTPTLNETFTIITTTDRIAGTFSSYMYPNSSSGDWAIIYGMDSVTLQYLVDGGSAPVPEPATMLLLGTSLAGLAGFRMKRKKG